MISILHGLQPPLLLLLRAAALPHGRGDSGVPSVGFVDALPRALHALLALLLLPPLLLPPLQLQPVGVAGGAHAHEVRKDLVPPQSLLRLLPHRLELLRGRAIIDRFIHARATTRDQREDHHAVQIRACR